MTRANWQLSAEDDYSEKDSTDVELQENTEEKKIVQCPSCQTKFAVNQSVLLNNEFPRFHCSRCDNVFSLDGVHSDAAPRGFSIQEPVKAEVENSQPETTRTFSIFEDEETVSSDRAITEQQVPETTQKVTKQVGGLQSILKQDNEEQERGMKESADRSVAARKEALEQMELVLNPRAMRRRPQRSQAVDDLEEQAEDTATGAPTINTKPQSEIPTDDTAAPSTTGWRFDSTDPSEDSPTLGNVVSMTDAPGQPDEHSFDTDNTYVHASRVQGWRSAAILSTPLVLFLAFLLCVGFILGQNPDVAVALSNSVIGPLDRNAPSGVFINNLQHRQVELESGERLHIISGELKNDSPETLQTVILEGITFSANEKVLQQILVPLNASLSKTRIESLSLDMVQDLQQSTPRKAMDLKPGESQDFSIALRNQELTPSAYYTARVYSVQ